MFEWAQAAFEAIRNFYNIRLTTLDLGAFTVEVEVGKLIGFAGTFLFAGRWIVQLGASKLAGKPVLPLLFWYMSISGSVLLLSYFIFGKNDSVGIVSNLFPMFIACYNLYLEYRHRAERRAQGSTP